MRRRVGVEVGVEVGGEVGVRVTSLASIERIAPASFLVTIETRAEGSEPAWRSRFVTHLMWQLVALRGEIKTLMALNCASLIPEA